MQELASLPIEDLKNNVCHVVFRLANGVEHETRGTLKLSYLPEGFDQDYITKAENNYRFGHLNFFDMNLHGNRNIRVADLIGVSVEAELTKEEIFAYDKG